MPASTPMKPTTLQVAVLQLLTAGPQTLRAVWQQLESTSRLESTSDCCND